MSFDVYSIKSTLWRRVTIVVLIPIYLVVAPAYGAYLGCVAWWLEATRLWKRRLPHE